MRYVSQNSKSCLSDAVDHMLRKDARKIDVYESHML